MHYFLFIKARNADLQREAAQSRQRRTESRTSARIASARPRFIDATRAQARKSSALKRSRLPLSDI